MKLSEEDQNKLKKAGISLLYNAIQTPDGAILESLHRHDFKSHKDSKTGTVYSVDGGLAYTRRIYDTSDYKHKELSLGLDANLEDVREVFKWGSYGKNGDQELHWILLKDMTDNHLLNIVKDGYGIAPLMKLELLYRIINGIVVGD